MGLRDAELPREARVVDRAVGSGSRAAVIAGNENHLSPRLRNARRDRTDAGFRDQLDGDAGRAVCIFKIVDELGQVLDGVDIVVGRRRDELHARRRAAGLRDPRIDFLRREIAALAGLCALGHLDLNLLRAQEVLLRHAEAARGDLLDRAVLLGAEPLAGLAALSGVGAAAQPVHRERDSLVSLLGEGAVAHGPRLEALHDLRHRLNLGDIHRVARRHEVEEPPQRVRVIRIIHQAAVFLEFVVISGPAGLLQEHDGLRAVEMVLLALAAP